MVVVHRPTLLPVLFALAMLIAGSGVLLAACDEDEVTIASICAARCRQVQECDDYLFEAEYDSSLKSCQQICEEELGEFYEEYEPTECKNKKMNLDQCIAERDCDLLNQWILDEDEDGLSSSVPGCEEEFSDLQDCVDGE